jgi:small subunit ribosomal protein S7
MRKTKPKKRYLQEDSVYQDRDVTLFVNNLMWDGKKSVAFKIFYDAIAMIDAKTENQGYQTWKTALENVSPNVEVKSRRIGGSNFQIPSEVRPSRKKSLGMKWLIGFSRKRNGKSMAEKLSQEILAASKGEGAAYKKREDTHRMAEANKAFAHFR